MLLKKSAGILFATLMLAGCGASPEKTIESNCVRLEAMSEINPGTDQKEACACLAEKLKEDMSEENLKKLATAMKKSKDGDDFDNQIEEVGLSDAAGMTFMGAAKSCAL